MTANLSPLTFARDYAAYRSRAASTPFADSRLLAAARFWHDHPEALGESEFESFWREDLPPLLASAEPTACTDLLPDELEEIALFLEELPSTITSSILPSRLWESSAKSWFYVGDLDRALVDLVRAGVGARSPRPVTAGGETPPLPLRIGGPDLGEGKAPIVGSADSLAGIDAIDLPRFLIDRHFSELAPEVIAWLERFDAEWRAQRDEGNANHAYCVLVEHDEAMRPVRGRLRVLQGQVEALSDKNGTDQVVFSHQLCASDDPQISGAYAALAALRHIPNSAFRTPHSALRGNFEFLGGDKELYGGDSLAFACFATAYGDWWSKDLHRERRLISGGVAFSGALNDQGQAAAISDASLQKKIERVFFSPLSHLVVPEANRAAAEAAVEQLRQRHPARRLRVIGVERAGDIVADHNIFIPERVCLGEFAVRAAAKYTRSVKVQVPLLAILGYLLLCLLYPKAWVGFDWDPAGARFDAAGITVVNQEGKSLWRSDFGYPFDTTRSLTAIANIDGDASNEVCCLLNAEEQRITPLVGKLFVFDDDGRPLFERSAIIIGEYPGDSSSRQYYQASNLTVTRTINGTRIITRVTKSFPARTHIRIWNSEGQETSWYINAGYAPGDQHTIIDSVNGVIHCAGVNNRLKAACLVSLRIDSTFGVSPPYSDPEYELRGVRHGNQIRYLVFPKSDLCEAVGANNNDPVRLLQETPAFFRFDIDELGNRSVFKDSAAIINYFFDGEWRLKEVRPTDLFLAARNEAVIRRQLDSVDWPTYESNLLRSARQWTDTGWAPAR